MNSKNVIVLGASANSSRVAFQGMMRLDENGYLSIPVNPKYATILGKKSYGSVVEAKVDYSEIDTISIYLSAVHSNLLIQEILEVEPRRIIFNPGAENNELFRMAQKRNIETENACTLVLLGTGQF